MTARLSGAAIVAMVLLALPALAAPTLQQMGRLNSTEVIVYTDSPAAIVRQDTTVRLAGRANTIDFEWASDSIDAASVRVHGGPALTIGEVIRPAGADKLLRWAVNTPSTGDYALETSFLLSGLKWSADYTLAWSPGSAAAVLGGWLTVKNESGVDLENLAMKFILGRPGAGSEQAVFEIPNLHELAAGASVRAAFFPPTKVPVRTINRIDGEAAPERVKRLLEITPPATGPLARTSLPAGPLTVVTPTDVPPASFLNATLGYEPSESFEIDLGFERDVVVRRRIMAREKTALEFDRLGKVGGFDTVETCHITVRNRLSEPAQIELVETVLETWELKTSSPHVLADGKAVMLLSVPAGGESAVQFTLVRHSGTRIP